MREGLGKKERWNRKDVSSAFERKVKARRGEERDEGGEEEEGPQE